MKKLAVLNSFAVWLILSVALMLFSGPAQAYVYDDFASAGINGSLWHDTGPNSGLFSQPGNGDSYLYYSDSGGKQDSLRSYNPVSGAFFVSMQYSNFLSTNSQQGNEFYSSGVQLMLADATKTFTVFEAKNTGGQFFQAVSIIGLVKTHLDPPIFSGVNSGWLGIGYNGILGPGGQVTFGYDSGTGWTELAACAPGFSQNPYFLIMGNDQYGTSLSFQVNQVQLTSTPLPPSVLLMGTGLLGLAGWRIRKR